MKDRPCSCADAEQLLAVCENCLADQQKILHRCNILHVRVLDRAFDACIDVGNWRRAVEHGTMLAELLRYGILCTLIRYKHTMRCILDDGI